MRMDSGTLDPRVRRLLRPVRVVWQSEGVDASSLLQEKGKPCLIKFSGAEEPGFILDFGRQIHGGLRITNGPGADHRPIPVRVRFGESVSETMQEPNNDHAIHDHFITIPWYGYHEVGTTGFRFVRIDLLEEGTQVEIKEVQGIFHFRDIEYLGEFECSDARLNAIWNTGAYTVHLCMQDMLWDGIKRDRLVWIGDMHPETMVINTVFGANEIVPLSLDYVREQTPLPGWMNGISSYSNWWVLIHHTWYRYHGNVEYLKAQREYLLGLLKLLRAQIDEQNREKMGNVRFLDWPSSENNDAIHMGLHSLLIMTLEAGAELCDILSETGEAAACREAVTRLRTHRPAATTSKQSNALMALSGLADANEINTQVLAQDPFHGVSTFYGYYVLQARAKAGDYQGCLDLMRTYWGKMLDLGATTFWEDFNLDWTTNAAGIDDLVPEGKDDIHGDFGAYCYLGLRHSLCHGWAAGPTAWLSEHVLGIRPLEPGFAKVLVDPHLGDLDFARGKFPTPHGLITVEHHAGAESKIEAPAGVEIVRR